MSLLCGVNWIMQFSIHFCVLHVKGIDLYIQLSIKYEDLVLRCKRDYNLVIMNIDYDDRFRFSHFYHFIKKTFLEYRDMKGHYSILPTKAHKIRSNCK